MTDTTADSEFSLLDFTPNACASQTSLSPSVEDAKAEALRIWFGTLGSCINKREAAQLTGLRSQEWEIRNKGRSHPEASAHAFSADQSFRIPFQRQQSWCHLARCRLSQLSPK